MPHPLIEQLKKDHQAVATLLVECKTAGIATAAGQSALGKAKTALLGHLKKEDQQLYPVLREAAKNDRRLASMLQMYSKDMEEVSKLALGFFDRYANGGSGYDFGKDFGNLVARLKLRIGNEESELYREFEKVQGAK
jgi:hypothetical protein